MDMEEKEYILFLFFTVFSSLLGYKNLCLQHALDVGILNTAMIKGRKTRGWILEDGLQWWIDIFMGQKM